jgi:hypothetical protein
MTRKLANVPCAPRDIIPRVVAQRAFKHQAPLVPARMERADDPGKIDASLPRESATMEMAGVQKNAKTETR